MTAPDFAAILNPWKVFTATDGHKALRALDGAELLAATVTELCTTGHGTHVQCPDCPTIAKLLAIGAAVMSATADTVSEAYIHAGGRCSSFADELLAALRAVQP